MESHPLLSTLQQLKLLHAQHPTHDSILPLLGHLDAQLPNLIHRHLTLTRQLTEKNIQNKQLTKILKKNHSKLNKKEEQCDNLQKELKRVNEFYSQKINKLTKNNTGKNHNDLPEHLVPKTSRKQTFRHTDIQCEILNQQTFHMLTRQNEALRSKLEDTQKHLMQQKLLNKDLSLRLQVLNVLHDEQSEELKDNSTLDADSVQGDPFEEEGTATELAVVVEEDEEGSSDGEVQNQEEECAGEAREGWSSWLWRGSAALLGRIIGKH